MFFRCFTTFKGVFTKLAFLKREEDIALVVRGRGCLTRDPRAGLLIIMFEAPVVVDGRSHLLGRLASIVAKELLGGQKVVVVRAEQITISGSRECFCALHPSQLPAAMHWRGVRRYECVYLVARRAVSKIHGVGTVESAEISCRSNKLGDFAFLFLLLRGKEGVCQWLSVCWFTT